VYGGTLQGVGQLQNSNDCPETTGIVAEIGDIKTVERFSGLSITVTNASLSATVPRSSVTLKLTV
jgi:hypothetical protein